MITAAGAGSGLDVPTLVAQLVKAERAPAQARIQRQESGVRTQLTAFGTLQATFAALGAALAPLKSGSALGSVVATSSNSAAFTAAAASGAQPGRYTIEVLETASAARLASAALGASAGSAVGTGTLTLEVGGRAFSVVIDGSNHSVAGIRDAINNAVGNTGVQASILNTADGVRLVLSARDSGAASALRVTQSGGDGGLEALVYDPGTQVNMTLLAPARDARIRVDGFEFRSATDRFSAVLDKVAIDVVASGAGAATLTIARDADGARKAIETLVTAYNGSVNTLGNLSRVDPAARTAGPLAGDSLARNARSQLRNELAASVTLPGSTVVNALGIGISSNVDGTLRFDAARFEAARAADPAGVMAYVKDLAERLDRVLQGLTGAGGSIGVRTEALNARLRRIGADKDALDDRMTQLEQRYRAQFAALDGLVGRLRSTSEFLARQLAGL